MKKLLVSFALAITATCLFAGQYDDVQYLYRGLYNHQGLTTTYDDYEFYNALLSAEGIWKKPGHYASLAGDRKYAPPTLVETVPNPLTGRVTKNRLLFRLPQPTYKNPGDDTLYGYANYLSTTVPISANYTNAYTVLVRYKHDGKICPESTESYLFNFGYGWGENRGLWVSLRGDDDNQHPFVYLGGTFGTDNLTATTNSPETRLSAGKWTDLVVARSPKSSVIYTLAEGGKICKQTFPNSATSKNDFYWFALGVDHESRDSDYRHIATTNTPIATHGARNNFRGTFARVALWKRMLTDDEVKAAMADDFADGDILRFGVANDSEKEFTGTNYLGGVTRAVTETDADDVSDWRHFANNLTPANPTATVKFTVGAHDFVYKRRLTVRLTSASAAGAKLSATLNGTALLSNAAAEPGATVTAEVPLSVLRVGDNKLVFTRTDAGAAPLLFDCFAIEDNAATDTGDYRGAKVADDIYASAWGWWKRPNDANGDGWATAGYTELPNALYAAEALKSHATHKWYFDGHPAAISIQKQKVTYPASGVTLENEPCLYFTAPQWTATDGKRRYGRADLFKPVFAITNAGYYSFATRIKLKD